MPFEYLGHSFVQNCPGVSFASLYRSVWTAGVTFSRIAVKLGLEVTPRIAAVTPGYRIYGHIVISVLN